MDENNVVPPPLGESAVEDWAKHMEEYYKKKAVMKAGIAGRLNNILAEMKKAGADLCSISFDGCGDSGMIESIELTANDGELAVTVETSLTDEVEKFCYDYLDDEGIDWYNDDGGYGSLQIATKTGKATLDVSVRFTSTSDYSFELGGADDTPTLPQ